MVFSKHQVLLQTHGPGAVADISDGTNGLFAFPWDDLKSCCLDVTVRRLHTWPEWSWPQGKVFARPVLRRLAGRGFLARQPRQGAGQPRTPSACRVSCCCGIGGGPRGEISSAPSRPARDARGARQSHARSPIAKDPRQQTVLPELLLCMGRTDQPGKGVWGWKPIVDDLRETHPSCATIVGSEKMPLSWCGLQVRPRVCLLPVLRMLRDKREHVARLAAHMALSDAAAARKACGLPSGLALRSKSS